MGFAQGAEEGGPLHAPEDDGEKSDRQRALRRRASAAGRRSTGLLASHKAFPYKDLLANRDSTTMLARASNFRRSRRGRPECSFSRTRRRHSRVLGMAGRSPGDIRPLSFENDGDLVPSLPERRRIGVAGAGGPAHAAGVRGGLSLHGSGRRGRGPDPGGIRQGVPDARSVPGGEKGPSARGSAWSRGIRPSITTAAVGRSVSAGSRSRRWSSARRGRRGPARGPRTRRTRPARPPWTPGAASRPARAPDPL